MLRGRSGRRHGYFFYRHVHTQPAKQRSRRPRNSRRPERAFPDTTPVIESARTDEPRLHAPSKKARRRDGPARTWYASLRLPKAAKQEKLVRVSIPFGLLRLRRAQGSASEAREEKGGEREERRGKGIAPNRGEATKEEAKGLRREERRPAAERSGERGDQADVRSGKGGSRKRKVGESGERRAGVGWMKREQRNSEYQKPDEQHRARRFGSDHHRVRANSSGDEGGPTCLIFSISRSASRAYEM